MTVPLLPLPRQVLQVLDATLKPKTLSKAILDEHMPAWRVPSQAGAKALCAPHAARTPRPIPLATGQPLGRRCSDVEPACPPAM